MEWLKNGMGSDPDYKRSLYDRGMDRIGTVLGYNQDGKGDVATLSLLTKYGLGNRRSLDQLIEFTGIDTRRKSIFADRCKQLHWVPYQFDIGSIRRFLLFFTFIYFPD
jgi:hypothetical protein